jgi:hypothetical protein
MTTPTPIESARASLREATRQYAIARTASAVATIEQTPPARPAMGPALRLGVVQSPRTGSDIRQNA